MAGAAAIFIFAAKTAAIILALALLLTLTAILLILFLPVRYEMSAEADEGLNGEVTLVWLHGFFRLFATTAISGGTDVSLKICGREIYHGLWQGEENMQRGADRAE